MSRQRGLDTARACLVTANIQRDRLGGSWVHDASLCQKESRHVPQFSPPVLTAHPVMSRSRKRQFGVVKHFVTAQLSGFSQFDTRCFVTHRADITQRRVQPSTVIKHHNVIQNIPL